MVPLGTKDKDGGHWAFAHCKRHHATEHTVQTPLGIDHLLQKNDEERQLTESVSASSLKRPRTCRCAAIAVVMGAAVCCQRWRDLLVSFRKWIRIACRNYLSKRVVSSFGIWTQLAIESLTRAGLARLQIRLGRVLALNRN